MTLDPSSVNLVLLRIVARNRNLPKKGTNMRCPFCGLSNVEIDDNMIKQYNCRRCGAFSLTRACHDDFDGAGFTKDRKNTISIVLRTKYERRGQKPSDKPLELGELKQITMRYPPLTPLEKMDNALLNLEKATSYVGYQVKVKTDIDFPYYQCASHAELNHILAFICKEEFIDALDRENPHNGLWVTPKGYERLRELKTRRRDSRQCFVAMWLDPGMEKVYEEAIRPAIEYVDKGEAEPRFKAVKIDNEEHTNDINDEIISQIRRSRFMVCDLTGYRGGVYFEAGFAFGLGLEVIYTCREDWIEKKVDDITDSQDDKRQIVQEGIHFDLEHRNRIEWKDKDLSEFRKRLENRIKAVIV